MYRFKNRNKIHPRICNCHICANRKVKSHNMFKLNSSVYLLIATIVFVTL